MLTTILISILSAILWRIRGGMGERQGIDIPCNKIYYALFVGVYASYLAGWDIIQGLIAFIATYTAYQLYGWGKYVGALTGGSLNKYEAECELIDDLLDETKLVNYPRLYGFVGTSLTGLIITFIIGLYFNSLWFMLCGLGMGLCYYIGHLICEHVYSDGKNGWNWGEWIFGFYLGICLGLLGV